MENTAPTGSLWAYREVTVFDRKNPRSVVNLLPVKMKQYVENLEAKWFTCSAKQLEAWCQPTEVEERLRITFWHEYGMAQDENRNINMKNVISPVCTREYFYRVVARNQSKLAYVMNPPSEYQIQVEEMLNLGLRKLREVLQLPLKEKSTGKPDHKLINELIKITMFLDNRVKGAVTQRLQITQQSLNLNANYEMREAPKTMGDINAEMCAIDKEMRELTTGEALRLTSTVIEGEEFDEPAEVIAVKAQEVSFDEDGEDI